MDPTKGAAGVPRLLRALALVPFVGVAGALTFTLVYMSTDPSWRPLWSQLTRDDLVIPVTMAVMAVLSLVAAIIVPRLVLRAIRRRAAAPLDPQLYRSIVLFMTALLSIGVLIFGFVGAFMVQDLRYWVAAAMLGLLPIALAFVGGVRSESASPSDSSGT